MIELKKITILDDTMKECIALDIAPEKKDFVDPNAMILALEYDFNVRNKPVECRAIYSEGKMVGLISYHYFVDNPVYKETCYRIRPLMIDKSYLGKGYEESALRAILEEIRTKPHGEAAAVFATHSPKEDDMAKLYESVGFIKTDLSVDDEDPDDSDIIVRMSL